MNLNEFLGEQFDADKIEIQDFTPAPEDWYMLMIDKSSFKPTKTGGKMLVLEMKVVAGPHENKRVTENLNLVNNNDDAVRIAKETLAKLCKAVDVKKPTDTAQLHNKPFFGYLVIGTYSKVGEDGKSVDKKKNELKKIMSVEQFQELATKSRTEEAAGSKADAFKTPSWMAK